MVSLTTIMMTTTRDAQKINYKVWVIYESEEVSEKLLVWQQEVVFMGDRRDGARARIVAREQEKVASEQQRKYSGAWRW